jgi:hypothetical protein
MSISVFSLSESEAEATRNDSSPSDLLVALLLTAFVFCFWSLFSTFFESFYRDDNVGGVIPVLVEMTRILIHGEIPNHTYSLGGGGGSALLLSMNGLLDPFVAVPAILMHNNPELLCNFIASLHLAIFAAGGFLLGSVLKAPRWAGIIAGLSLAFSGYFFIWVGNWIIFIIPYAFLPWILAGVFGIFYAQSSKELLVYEILTSVTVLLLLVTGGPFPPFHGGIATMVVIASIIADKPSEWKKLILRLVPVGIVFLVAAIPVIFGQKALFDAYGGRVPNSADWVNLSVPLEAYLGLFVPSTLALWRFPWTPRQEVISNVLLMAGVVPAWYILRSIFRTPSVFLQTRIIVLLGGIALLVLMMSPNAFDLSVFFAETPVLNIFRWPFRAIPAFHVLIILLFLWLTVQADSALDRRWQIAAVTACIGVSVFGIGYELSLMQIRDSTIGWWQEFSISRSRSPVLSWYHITPHLDDPDSWDEQVLRRLRNSGYVINVCRSELPFHNKPRLFFYGNMGPLFGVHTVHMYMVPFPSAYGALGMTVKGCIRDWQAAKEFIEHGPQKPPSTRVEWTNPLGPKNFMELMEKTYVGAAIVDTQYEAPMQYFLTSPNWQLLARKETAAIFIRRPNS